MIKLYEGGAYLINGTTLCPAKDYESEQFAKGMTITKEAGKAGTIAYHILKAHNHSGNMEQLKLKFDAMTSHDITYVGIIQTAKASGMTEFPLPYVMTNCHNSLCAVGGTINEDDHVFGLSAAKKYGGIFVPPHIAVMHQYMREMMAGGGRMILGSDSHTRYGALGTMAIGEGGGELVKQLLGTTYDLAMPDVIAVYLDGKPAAGVGPHDIALAIVGAVFKNGYVKNKVMEFVGPGIASMSTDFRNGIDVMTTETTCLSSIWQTDEDTRHYLAAHGRADDYRQLAPAACTYYDGAVYVDLSRIKPMIALPFHPSNVYTIDELNSNPADILREVEKEAARISGGSEAAFTLTDKVVDGKLRVQQGIIAGCAGGTYSSIMAAAHILNKAPIGNDEFTLAVYPSSQPVFMDLVKKGIISDLMATGATVKTAFCGPCFGAGDTPANNALSIRHTTRNFPNREGSKPGAGQMSAVALMDARSIAATSVNKGLLTSAEAFADDYQVPEYTFDPAVYTNRVYQGYRQKEDGSELIYGPNIKDWPEMSALTDHILLRVCSKIMDDVTTTDELIPSGETSSYRSNPLGLAEFTLSRRDPHYVGRAKAVNEFEKARGNGTCRPDRDPLLKAVFDGIHSITDPEIPELNPAKVEIGSVLYAVRPGDGSAREQAASCQRVLGGLANIAREYATKRYRSNVMNWGMIPFQLKEMPAFEVDDFIFVPNIRKALDGAMSDIPAYVIHSDGSIGDTLNLFIADMTEKERSIVKAGCLINFNRGET